MFVLAVCGFEAHSCATTSRAHNNLLCLCVRWAFVVLRHTIVQQQARLTTICLVYGCVGHVQF